MSVAAEPPRRRRVGVVLFEDVKALDFVGPAEVFVEANQRVDAYEVEFLSLDGGQVMTSLGVPIAVHGTIEESGTFDTVIVPGSERAPVPFEDAAFVAAVRDISTRTQRIASVCSGAFALAAAGLLNGRSVTTHWKFARTLADFFPEVNVEPDSIFTRDGEVYTSAGVAAGIDLALSLVEADYGSDVSRSVAQLLLVYMQRAGGQSQFSASLKALPPRTSIVREVFDYVHADPTRKAGLQELAEIGNVSTRHLSRLIREETGTTPSAYVASIRLDIATGYLESGCTIAQSASGAGFPGPTAFRRAFAGRFGVTPAEYQRRFRSTVRASGL